MSSIEHVEKKCPGFKVVAGPFDVEVASSAWRSEQAECRAALKLQRRAGVESKIVMWRGQAYVLRTAEGWREDGQGSLSLPPDAEGLRCPVCKHGPYRRASALRQHRCALLPPVNYGSFKMLGRLSEEQIQQAVEAASKA